MHGAGCSAGGRGAEWFEVVAGGWGELGVKSRLVADLFTLTDCEEYGGSWRASVQYVFQRRRLLAQPCEYLPSPARPMCRGKGLMVRDL